MKIDSLHNLASDPGFSATPQKVKSNTPKDSFEISDAGKVMSKVDDFLNLSKKDRADLSGMSPEEKTAFVKIVAKLIQSGIVGYEEFEINGHREKHFLANQIGDERLYGARPKTVRERA